MFVLTDERFFDWPVHVQWPDTERPGSHATETFTARFRMLPVEEAEAVESKIRAAPASDARARQHDLLRRVVVGWRDDIRDADGQPVPFGEQMFERLLQWPPVVIALYQAYTEAVSGGGARQGN